MALSKAKKDKIREMGGHITTVREWLDLTPAEVHLIDMKIQLGELLREKREDRGITQSVAAKTLKTSQARVSNLEKGDATMDRLVKSALMLGVTKEEIAKVISG